MIKIKINKEGNNYKNIVITGHANYAEYGKDIVCAATSATVLTTLNGIIALDNSILEVKEEQYDKVVEVIRDIQNNRLDYNFNILGLIGVVINYKIKRERYFYCAEFVKYVLEQSNICDLPELVKPEDFKEIDNLNVVYNGQLREYGN